MIKSFKLNLGKKSTKNPGKFKEKIQLFARGLLVPITLLAFAGLFLGIGAVIGKYVTDGAGNILANIIKQIGNTVFYLLPLLFAIAIASSMTNNNGTAILSAIVAWVGLQIIAGAQFIEIKDGWSWFNVIDFHTKGGASVISKKYGFNALDLSVFGGFFAGPIGVITYNKFKDQRMPIFLQMFQGQRIVPIMGLVFSIPIAFMVSLIWPWLQKGFIEFGQSTGKLPGGLDSLLFGIFERALLPTGLHHMFYSPLLYTFAGATVDSTYTVASQVSVNGATFVAGTPLWIIDVSPFKDGVIDAMPNVEGIQTIDYSLANGAIWDNATKTFTVTDIEQLSKMAPTDLKVLAGDRAAFQKLNGSAIQFSWINNLQDGHSVHLGRFSAGKFPMMVFGIPAAGAAIIMAAPKENRKLVSGVVGSAALTSLLTGITEPFEYSFLFLAPVLFYGFHIWMAGLSYMLANVAGVYYGPTFGGIIDFFIYGIAPQVGGQITNFYWLLLIGLGLASLYFFGFYFAITKFNLSTPGRGNTDIKLVTKQDYTDAKKTSVDKLAMKGQIMYKALGGNENLKIVTNCASRLRVTIIDPSKVDYALAKTTQPFGIVGEGKTSQQYIYGPSVQTIADTVLGLFEGKIKPIKLKSQKVDSVAKVKQNSNKKLIKTINITSPITGIMRPIESLKDGVFSKKMMGDGVYIKLPKLSKKQIFRAPISGKLTTVFPTGHAYGIESKEGIEILLHIGVDTVKLNGKGFKSLVKQGSWVKAGDPVAEVNTISIKDKVTSCDPVIIITSGQKIQKFTDKKKVIAGKSLFKDRKEE